MYQSRSLITPILLICTATTMPAALAAPMFQPLGTFDGTGGSGAYAISTDGTVITGESFAGGGFGGFRWTSSTGMERLGPAPAGLGDGGMTATSLGGAVLVGVANSTNTTSGDPVEALRWTAATGIVSLGQGYGLGVSGDGAVVVGMRGSEGSFNPYRWTEPSGMVNLVGPGGSTVGTALGVSLDGTTIVGSSRLSSGVEKAVRWVNSVPFVLDDAQFSTFATAISADGTTIVGGGSGTAPIKAFRWTESGGMVDIGQLPGTWQSVPFAVSGDGTVIVGHSGQEPFLWHQAHGMRPLADVMTELGIDLTGWTLRTANGISADGTMIVGSARGPRGFDEAYLAVIPEPAGLAGGALAMLMMKRRRRRSRALS